MFGDRRLATRLLSIGVIGHLAVVVVALLLLLVASEGTRPSFFLLYLPRHPFAAAGLVLLPIALISRRRVLIALEIVAMLIALFPLMGLRVGFSRTPQHKPIRLLTYNVFYAKLDNAALANEIVGADPDVVVLQAGRTAFATLLQTKLPGFTVRIDDEFILATRFAVSSVEAPVWLEEGVVAAARAQYVLEGPAGAFRVINVHPVSARAGLFDREDPEIANTLRAKQITAAAEAAAQSKAPAVIAGDTNLPGLSLVSRRALQGFDDAFDEVGLGFGYTFPAKLPWMRIDRVLGGPRVRFLRYRTLPRGASDHRAVVVDFEIAP